MVNSSSSSNIFNAKSRTAKFETILRNLSQSHLFPSGYWFMESPVSRILSPEECVWCIIKTAFRLSKGHLRLESGRGFCPVL